MLDMVDGSSNTCECVYVCIDAVAYYSSDLYIIGWSVFYVLFISIVFSKVLRNIETLHDKNNINELLFMLICCFCCLYFVAFTHTDLPSNVWINQI